MTKKAFTARAKIGTLAGAGYVRAASGFARVVATGSRGGLNHKMLAAPSFTVVFVGPWN